MQRARCRGYEVFVFSGGKGYICDRNFSLRIMLGRKEVIDEISRIMKTLPDVETYLFGSSARGDFNDSSDIDLLFLLPDGLSVTQRIKYEGDIAELLLPIELETDIPVSPIILQQKVWCERKTPFTVNVTNERIRL